MRAIVPGLFLCLLLGCSPSPSGPDISWQFDVRQEERDLTSGIVSLVVDGERHLITEKPVGPYWMITPSQFEQRQIPNDAVSACSSWWAGVGEDIYVKIEGDSALVYRRKYGGSGPGIPPYSLLKTIPIRRNAEPPIDPHSNWFIGFSREF